MEIIGALLVSTIAGLSTMFGALVIFFKFKEQNINKFITASLSFSLAIMIGISITDLIPESSYILLSNYGMGKGILASLLAFIIGIILVKYLHKLMDKTEATNDLYKLGILNMLALILHNFPEGIATFMSSYKDIELGLKLGLAIAFHNIPEGISIVSAIIICVVSLFPATSYTSAYIEYVPPFNPVNSSVLVSLFVLPASSPFNVWYSCVTFV